VILKSSFFVADTLQATCNARVIAVEKSNSETISSLNQQRDAALAALTLHQQQLQAGTQINESSSTTFVNQSTSILSPGLRGGVRHSLGVASPLPVYSLTRRLEQVRDDAGSPLPKPIDQSPSITPSLSRSETLSASGSKPRKGLFAALGSPTPVRAPSMLPQFTEEETFNH
jgi:hypothetical protein